MRIAVVLVVLASTACPPERPLALEPIKIGVLSPISGPLGSRGPSRENAARLAGEAVNAGGGLFDGRRLELVFRDSATAQDVAVAAAQELVDEGVVGIVGPSTSGESGGVKEIANQNEVPMISCCSTAAGLTASNAPNSGFFFRTTPSDKLQGKALAFLAETGVAGIAQPCTQAAFIYRNDAYGQGFKDVFLDEYDRAPIAQGFYGTPDAEADATELQAKGETLATDLFGAAGPGETCIVVISFGVDGGLVINAIDAKLGELIAERQVSQPNFALSFHFLVGDGANSSAFATTVGNLGPKIIGTVPFHADNEAYTQFSKAFQARYEEDSEPVAFTSQSYDAVFVMALAITQAKSAVGKDIRNKLYSVSGQDGGTRFDGAFFGEVAAAILDGDDVDYVGPSGEVTFDSFGDVVGDYVLWQVDPTETGFAVVEREALRASDFNP